MRLEGEAWSRYFRDFQRSAFRLELRPVYAMPGEADELRRFRAGEKPPADYHYGWLDTMAAARAAGKTVRRVRVVRQPLTGSPRYPHFQIFAWVLFPSTRTCRTGHSTPSRYMTSAWLRPRHSAVSL